MALFRPNWKLRRVFLPSRYEIKKIVIESYAAHVHRYDRKRFGGYLHSPRLSNIYTIDEQMKFGASVCKNTVLLKQKSNTTVVL